MTPFGVRKFRSLVAVGSFSVLTEFLMGFLGSALSGHMLGEDALAGVSLLSPVLSTVIFLSDLFSVGMGVSYALEMGRCQKRRAWELFSQGLWSVLGVGALLAIALILFGDTFVAFFGPSEEVAVHARAYLRWFAPIALLQPLAGFLLACCYADGDDRQCYIVYVAQIASNVLVSYAALRAGWGTAGCALGALAGFATAIALLALHFIKPTNSFRLVRHFRWADSLRVVKSSFGDSCCFLCNALLYLVLGKVFVVRFGSDLLPVLSVIFATFGFLEIFNGVAIAAQPLVSVYIGENNTLGARRVMTDALRISCCEGLAALVALAVFPDLAITVVGITDPANAEAARLAVRLVSIGFVFTAIGNLLNGYYILIGRDLLAVLFTIYKWLLAPVVAVLLAAPFGMGALWLALGLASPLAMTAFAVFLARRYGRDQVPLLLPRAREANIRMFDLPLVESEIVQTAHAVGAAFRATGAKPAKVMRAELMTEEILMAVRERNKGRRVTAEVTLDLNGEGSVLTLRDDGEIFDITDADQKVMSLRTFLVASVMERQEAKVNLITSGFNRNVFRF